MTKHTSAAAAVALFATIGAATAATIVSNNPFELKLQNNGAPSVLGANVGSYFLDAGNEIAGDTAQSYDFVRFDDLFVGAGPLLPEGATVLNATLQMTTSLAGNAQTGGAFGVAPLLAPFAESNVYADYTGPGVGFNQGPSFQNGHAGRPSGGFSGMATAGSVATANVTLLVQQWAADPSTAHGFVIGARTTDGWSVSTVGAPEPEKRPTLLVEYVTEPTTTFRFQQGMNDYTGNTTASLDDNGTTTDGANVTGTSFLDGADLATSRDVQALLKFDNIFGDLEGQIKSGENILRAYLVLTTANSTDSHSGGTFDVHQMLVNWDTTSTYSSFGGDGPDVTQGEVSSPLSAVRGMTQNARMLLDVTSAVQSWQSGAQNYGLNVQSNTTDGWGIFYSGAGDTTVRPELIVVTGIPEPGSVSLLAFAGVGLLGMRRRRG